MAKKSFFLFLFSLFLCNSFVVANEINKNETMQIIAQNVDQNGTIITATGDIIVFSPNYFINANKIIYDRNNTTMELFGNVNISKNNETISLTNYAFLDMKNEINNATPILLIDKKTNIWIDAKDINKTSDLHIINSATLSSCECLNPTWSIGFSNGDYNTTSQWINTYNNTLYVHGIPAWYFLIPAVPYVSIPSLAVAYLALKMPYMGFSTNTNRRSGLLKPQFGYGQNDGFFYAQPIYYAPEKNIDFEYIPQLRTKRGNGHEFKARYVDSNYSKLEFSSGIFVENDTYFKENSLLNQKHYGGTLKYDRKKLFSGENSSDGLYFYLQNMNDIEYSNTRYNSNNDNLVSDKILESKIKYFYNTSNYNSYVEAINYNDISISNNDQVMQVTPSFGFHKYENNLFINKLTNSIDLKYKRQDRKVGLGADSFDLVLPFAYSKYFFDDYLLFSYSKTFDFHQINYTNDIFDNKKDGTLINNKDTVSLEVDLLKPFETKVHALKFNLKYEKPTKLKENGDLFGINSNDENLTIFPFDEKKENITLSFNQSLFNKNNLNPIVNHKINQKLVFDKNGSSTFENLENEISINLPFGSFSNRVLFNHDEKLFINSSSSMNLKFDDFFTTFDYSYSLEKNATTQMYKNGQNLETITGYIGSKVFKYYTLSYKEQYDLIKHESKLKEYKMGIDKRCWALDLSFKDNIIATATVSDKAKRQSIIYATITLKPIFSFSQKFIQDESEE